MPYVVQVLPAWATVVIAAITAGAGVTGGLLAMWKRMNFDREENVTDRANARDIARADRVFDRRASVYEEMLGLVDRWNETVDATDKRWRAPSSESGPRPAADEPDDEVWRTMLIRLRTIGSPVVTDAFRAFTGAVDNFYMMIIPVRSAMDGRLPDLDGKRADLHTARTGVGTAAETLEQTVRDELDAR